MKFQAAVDCFFRAAFRCVRVLLFSNGETVNSIAVDLTCHQPMEF
jgi:hypothetical protein